MAQVAIITDSLACLPPDMTAQHDISIVPIQLIINGKIFRDLTDITPAEAYRFLDQDPEHFATSPSSPAQFLEVFRQASLRAPNIFCITMSAGLSTEYNVALLAKEQAETEIPGLTVRILDSRNVTAAEGFIVLAAARAAAQGKGLEDVINAAVKVKEKVHFLMFLETIKHVYRTGRIPKVASQIGTMLNIKPMLTVADGLVHFRGVVRSREQGVNHIIQELRQKIGNKPVHVGIMHAAVPGEAEELRRRVALEFNCAELWATEFSPVMGYATGKGTLGFAFYCED